MSDEKKTYILIVEDSNTQAVHLQAVLESNGYEVDWAKDGYSAKGKLEEKVYDMVLTDIQMPGMSGYELCKYIKSDARWRQVPVILLTSRKDPKNIILGLECGCDSFFTKPYEPSVVIKRIEHLLYSRKLRNSGKLKMGIEIVLFGKVITINSEKEQILDLLVSSFEEMIQTNTNLEESKRKLAEANRKIEDYIEILENRVRTSEERYRTVFDLLAEGIMICDYLGHIKTINSANLNIFSYASEDLSFRMISDFVPEIETPLDAWMGDDTYRYLEDVRCTRLDGEEIYINVSISRIGDSSHADYACLVHDRTAGKKVEDRLRQTEKMEAIGQLTGGIAHDYNNQLTVIEGAVEELKENIKCEEVDSLQLVGLIASASKAGAALTRRLLTFSRAHPVDARNLNIWENLQSVKALVAPLVGKKIHIRVERRGDDIWPVRLDPSQFENAIINLCINARDAMINGGEIAIVVENVSIEDEMANEIDDIENGNYVLISLSDTGAGIPVKIQSKIFEPFFTTKPVGKGTGMGLAMVYGFVKQANGQLRVYSEQGVGTTFRMYFPHCKQSAELQEPLGKVIERTERSLNILLVDDDAMIRKLANKQLISLGHQAECVESFKEAHDLLSKDNEYDLLIIDVTSGEINYGCALVDELPVSSISGIIITSGYLEVDLLGPKRCDKPIRFLYKPYNKAQLALTIDAILCEGVR